MNPQEGFVDLRLNRPSGESSESFWPSFTDIMTVILMIFMIAMVVLLLRNMELVNQLRATMEAERTAQELARATGEEKESLAIKLQRIENEMTLLRMQLMRKETLAREQQETIGDQSERIARLLAEKERLTLRRDQLEAESFTLSQRLTSATTTIEDLRQTLETARQDLAGYQQALAAMRAELDDMKAEYASTRQQLSGLQERHQAQTTQLQAARTSEQRAGNQLATLKSEYNELMVRYNKLVKPARTAEGHFVVEVRYSKQQGRMGIELKTQDDDAFSRVDEKTLHRRLAALKASSENGLYVKVIFPKESGLTFNEAWAITSDLHSRYDYYFQDEGPEPIPLPE
jgi:chromosome segregation ATPase